MWFRKACPHCHGDLYTARDAYGPFLSCIQCGYLRDLVQARAIAVRVTKLARGARIEERLVPQAAEMK